MLQVLPPQRPQIPHFKEMGETGTGEDRAAGEERGRAGDVAGDGDQFGARGGGYCGCGADADCEWEPYGVGDWTGAEECC